MEMTSTYDNIYADNSWMRVEICESSDYSTANHCEVQPASAWGDSEITVNFNQGAFEVDDSAYLFVIDADGSPSTALEITIEEEDVVSLGTVLLGR
jgi:hypothetical protein